MRTCQVCGRLYAGYQCPCRKKQRSHHARRSTGSGGGRKWRYAAREARVLGGLPVDTAAAPAAAECEHAGSEQWYVCPRCSAVFTGDRCPACWERWQAEMAGAGDPGAFRIVEDDSPGNDGGASDPLDPGFCPERD